MAPTLTMGQTEQFVDRGYLSGLDVFSFREMDGLRVGYGALCALLEPGEGPGAIREWHMASRWLYDVCSAPALLDLVEGVLGPDFYMWGSQFFAKSPRSSSTVAWHQDGYYWPLEPLHHSVTAWLAFEDVDESNGAMQVIPGSHRAGLLQHRKHVSESVLTLELEGGTFSADDAAPLNLVAGQASIHHDSIVHGSPANASDRARVGLTVRFSRSDVRCDLSRAPQFRAYPLRGQDKGTNPVGEVPVVPFARLNPQMHIRSLDEDYQS
jgi:ectoine hydroxylase-related dioxygenase (phytanoyl-CoA dioxygenase family)